MMRNELKMKGILSQWNIGEVKLMKYRMNIMKITSGGRTFYLKERRGTTPWERMEEYRITRFLIKNGVNAETPILNNRGDPYTEKGGSYYSLYESLGGNPVKDVNADGSGRLFRLGKYLSGFHFTLDKCPFEKETRVWDLFDYLKGWLFDRGSGLNEWAGKVYGEISSYEIMYRRLPSQLVHSDAHLKNVLWRGDEILGLVDFERIRQSPRIGDLAYLIASSLRDSGSTFEFQNFHRRVRELIRGYTINLALSDDEAAILPHLVILILLQYAMFYANQGYAKAAFFHKKSIDYLIDDKDYYEAFYGH
jgi:Ser/Thr protein kinase RdoA (MazF antagonist)